MGTVVVTGASSGLGAEMARQFAARGWDLALCARRTERLDALAEEIRTATGRRVETAALDVTDPDAVPAVLAAAARAKKSRALRLVRLERYEEGLSVQILHVGSYADEAPTPARPPG